MGLIQRLDEEFTGGFSSLTVRCDSLIKQDTFVNFGSDSCGCLIFDFLVTHVPGKVLVLLPRAGLELIPQCHKELATYQNGTCVGDQGC